MIYIIIIMKNNVVKIKSPFNYMKIPYNRNYVYLVYIYELTKNSYYKQ